MIDPIRLGWARAVRARARKAARAADWAEAARLYGRIVARGIATPRDRIQQAHALKDSGDIPAAERAYREAAALFRLDTDAQRQLGLFLRHHGEEDAAVDVLARALALDPAAADIAVELDDMGVAETTLDERMIGAVMAGGDTRPARSWRGLAGQWHRVPARLHERAGRWAAAARHRRALLAGDPHRPGTLAAIGRALLAAGDAGGAIAAFRHALVAAPRRPELYLDLGRALAAAGRRAAATQAWLAAWRLRPGEPQAGAELRRLGWTDDDLARLTARAWGFTDPAAPEALSLRERAIWARLAVAVGHGG